jgi:uncharacterized membrane protein YvlD (DUF360 family)
VDALLKRSGRAGRCARFHWYLAGGLQLVLAFSRYVARFTTVIVNVDIRPLPHLLSFTLLLHNTFYFSCIVRSVFLLLFYCLLPHFNNNSQSRNLSLADIFFLAGLVFHLHPLSPLSALDSPPTTDTRI